MSDYAPTEEDFIRVYGVDGIGVENQANINRARRALAKLKADALREAADMFAIGFSSTYPGATVRDKLTNRANRIEGEA